MCTFTYQAPVALEGYQLYFGQLHAHTNISDGAGSVTEAFQHASQVDNLTSWRSPTTPTPSTTRVIPRWIWGPT